MSLGPEQTMLGALLLIVTTASPNLIASGMHQSEECPRVPAEKERP